MKGSKWVILVVVLLVVGVVVAKYARAPETSAGPPAVAQAPQATAGAPAPGDADSSSPTATGSQTPEPEVAGEAEDSVSPEPAQKAGTPVTAEAQQSRKGSEPGPSAAADPPKAASEKPEGPLPGSKLDECLKNGRPTMADFGLGTCKWCKMMEPILKETTQDYWGKANILFVELDKYPDLARRYRIATMPTQIFFDASGKQVNTHMGFLDRAGIDEQLGALGVKLGVKPGVKPEAKK